MSAPTRSPVLGYNHNIRHRGIVFHIQTEDSGVENPHIYTHIFHSGAIFASRKLEYDGEASEETVKALMQAQHKAVLKDLKRGAFDPRINAQLGDEVDDSESAPVESEELGDPTAPHGSAGAGGRPSTDEDTHDDPAPPLTAAASGGAGAEVASAVPEPAGDEASEDATEPMEAVAADVAAALDAVQDESTSPTAEVRVAWRQASNAPARQREASASPSGSDPSSEDAARRRRESGAPRVPHPDESPGAYRRRRPSWDVVESPLADAAAREAQAQGKGSERESSGPEKSARSEASGVAGDAASSEPAAPRSREGRHSGVVVSRPSVIVGGPTEASGSESAAAQEAKGEAEGETAAQVRQRQEKRRREGLFGQDLISEKSLDEVILAYLSEDGTEE